jgi:Ser-tRNA(Ala) deacylase AlaX
MKFSRTTRKVFYEKPMLFALETTFIKCIEDCIELEATIAYPEGGGQESDVGILTTDTVSLRFIHAKKRYAHSPLLSDFPGIQVDGIVLHQIHPDDIDKMPLLKEGEAVVIKIDVEKRYAHSLSHTASHLLYAAVMTHRPDVVQQTLGCHIKSGAARFDFATQNRFTIDELAAMQIMASDLSKQALPIFISAHPEVPDARIWCCDQYRIPCGGTHLSSTLPIGDLQLSRKSLGAGKERIICQFPQAQTQESAIEFLNIEYLP